MAEITLYHNKNCGTSRKALALLEDRDVEFDTILYLKEPLTRGALEKLLDMLVDEPADLVRKDKFFKELGLDPDDYTDRDAVIDLLLEHPRLMQRPVVVRGKTAVICRPVERVEELL